MLVVMVFFNTNMPTVPQARVKSQKSSKEIYQLLADLPLGYSWQAFQVCEFFAGDGMVSRSAKYGMVACAQLDIEYGIQRTRVHKQNSFDLLQPSGLAFLGLCLVLTFFSSRFTMAPNV